MKHIQGLWIFDLSVELQEVSTTSVDDQIQVVSGGFLEKDLKGLRIQDSGIQTLGVVNEESAIILDSIVKSPNCVLSLIVIT